MISRRACISFLYAYINDSYAGRLLDNAFIRDRLSRITPGHYNGALFVAPAEMPELRREGLPYDRRITIAEFVGTKSCT